MSEQFREMAALHLSQPECDDCEYPPIVEIDPDDAGTIFVDTENAGLSVPEARALRDWLNRALPEDK